MWFNYNKVIVLLRFAENPLNILRNHGFIVALLLSFLPRFWNPMTQWQSESSGEDLVSVSHLIKGLRDEIRSSWAHTRSESVWRPWWSRTCWPWQCHLAFASNSRLMDGESSFSRLIDLSSCSAVVEFGRAAEWTLTVFLFCRLLRHVAVLMETIKKGVHDADSEARSVARKWVILCFYLEILILTWLLMSKSSQHRRNALI